MLVGASDAHVDARSARARESAALRPRIRDSAKPAVADGLATLRAAMLEYLTEPRSQRATLPRASGKPRSEFDRDRVRAALAGFYRELLVPWRAARAGGGHRAVNRPEASASAANSPSAPLAW